MSFIYSTDKDVQMRISTMCKRGAKRRKSKVDYVSFVGCGRSTGKTTGKMNICANLSKRLALPTKSRVVLAYDKENNEIAIIPTFGGNFDCYNAGAKGSETRTITALKFLLAVGFDRENLPYGRYEAQINDDGNIHVYLNKPLHDDEQSARLKWGGVKHYAVE